MQYKLEDMIVTTDGKKVLLQKARGSIVIEFADDFTHTTTFPQNPPEEYREFLEHYADNIARSARLNALEEGLPADKAWDDYYKEQLDALKSQWGRRIERGIEFKPPRWFRTIG